MGWEQRLDEVFERYTPELTITPAAKHIAWIALKDIDDLYGPESENPLDHHNADHGVDIIGRSLFLAKLFKKHIKEDYFVNLPDVLVVAGACHDYDQTSGSWINEMNSSIYSGSLIDSYTSPPWKDIGVFKNRVDGSIMSTQVEKDQDGRLVQVNLRTGDQDPARYILAFADINGIAMEGEERMKLDCRNLSKELHGPDVDERKILGFLATQPGFMRSRLNDWRIKEDLTNFFPDNFSVVYETMREEFAANIARAFALAQTFRDQFSSSDTDTKA